MRDRTRSIRQDFVFQRTVSRDLIEVLEYIVRFRTLS